MLRRAHGAQSAALEPVDEDVNLPKRGAGVGMSEEGAQAGLDVFSSSDKGELLYRAVRCDRANRGGLSEGAKDGRSEGIIDDPRPFNAAARSDEPVRDESRRRLARRGSRSLNPTEKRPDARTVDASESRGGRRVCALSKDSLHGPAGGRPVLSHDRARCNSPLPGVAKKTVRASGAAESIDKARCGGECGVSLPRFEDDERNRPPIRSTSESHRASGPARNEGGGGGGGLSAIMLRIGRPSVDDVGASLRRSTAARAARPPTTCRPCPRRRRPAPPCPRNPRAIAAPHRVARGRGCRRRRRDHRRTWPRWTATPVVRRAPRCARSDSGTSPAPRARRGPSRGRRPRRRPVVMPCGATSGLLVLLSAVFARLLPATPRACRRCSARRARASGS